jgi:hypothetical protein
MKRSNMANGQTKKRTLLMMMELQFDFQPQGPDQKKQNQPQNVSVKIWLKLSLWEKLKVILNSLSLNC